MKRFVVLLAISVTAVVVNVQLVNAGNSSELNFQKSAAAQTAKQQCIKTCRARYRDCRRLNQVPASECRGIYQDCTRYTCSGLGPG